MNKPVDMSAHAVTERLRRVAEQRKARFWSAEAVTRRLRKVEQLRRLCLSLGKAKHALTGPGRSS